MTTKSTSGGYLPITAMDSAPEEADEKQLKVSAISKAGAYAATSYMACAVLLVMFNKAALSSYRFPCANVITLCQMISSCFLLYVLRRLKLISFSSNESGALGDSFGTLLASMEAVRGVNVPMYTTLRRTTVFFTMVIEFIFAGQRYSRPVLGSVVIVLLGAFVAGAHDMSFDSYGYLVVVLANISTAVYLTTISRIGKTTGLNSFGLMWCNGVLCGPVLLVWIFIQGDIKTTMNFQYLLSPGFLVVLFFSCILAFILNYTVFLNTTLNSALTQTICGNLKDFFTIALGWAIFGGLALDLLNVTGQLICFAGSGIYAYYKFTGK
ncbi:hypothetical protein SASPL_130996 [Salvia splendens]|uniref:Sugar phosphate transporter domain-containing protein n=1 Tax=Salvia splendens TaxID=180675 RepID=A0A8X8X8E5_SALSN|nr:hypothetical protein SASPL_130996 [Salvia splendens]